MRVILLGPPGAGKGTQAVLLSSVKGIAHVATGDMLRAEIAKDSDLGKQVKSYIDSGLLVPDEIVIDLIRHRFGLADCKSGFVLDGFPRTLAQAQALNLLLSELKLELDAVIDLAVPDNVLIDRIRKRGAEGSGRSDDTVEVASNRLKVYWEETAPVTEFYKNNTKLLTIDGLGSIEEVHDRIIRAVHC